MIRPVPNWRQLWKSWSIWAASLGLALPELLQLLADNTSALAWLDDGYKSGIRFGALAAVIVLRAVHQPKMAEK